VDGERMKTVKVTVTRKMAKRAWCGSTSCPVASALKAKGFRNVNVQWGDATFTYKRKWYEADLPKIASRFIADVETPEDLRDGDGVLRPFSFFIHPKPTTREEVMKWRL
jgi:hypothetical protein